MLKPKSVAVLVLAATLAMAAFAMWPICAPLTAEEVAAFNSPIERREDRDFYPKVFQKRGAEWQQCKTRLSRAFFF